MFAYAANNPVRYIDPDGKQSIYLPGGGTTFNGPCPGMKYNIEEYSKQCDTIAEFVDGITSNGNGLAILIDKVFFGNKYGNNALRFYFNVLFQFDLLKVETKVSERFDLDNNGYYSKKEIKLFVNFINTTMLLNYSDQADLGPYKVSIPQISEKEADIFLNNKNILFLSEYDIDKFNYDINMGDKK